MILKLGRMVLDVAILCTSESSLEWFVLQVEVQYAIKLALLFAEIVLASAGGWRFT